MSESNTVTPPGDKMRKALKWLAEMQQEHPEKGRKAILREAQTRFDLSPKESEFLEANFS